MKKKSLTKNYFYNLIYQMISVIVPLVLTPYLSRVLGAENIGIYSFTLSINIYFILFGSLGIAMYGQREIAYEQNDKKAYSKTFYEILIMRFITLGISTVLFYFIFCTSGDYSKFYRILLLEILASSFEISWFFQGLEDFKKTVIRFSIAKITSIFLIIMLVKGKGDLVTYFYISILIDLIGNLSLWLYLPKYLCKVKFKELNIFKHLKPTIVLFIPQIAIQVYTVLDKTMIGLIVSDKSEVGYYEQSQKIVKLLLTVATSYGAVMFPRMSNTFASGNSKKIKEYLNVSFSVILMLAFPLMFGIISVLDKFVPLFYGPGYDKIVYIIAVISPIIIAIGLSNVVGTQYFLPTKQQKKYTISVICGAIVNFILNMILIRYFQSIGASIASVVAEFTVTGIQLYYVRKEFNISSIIKKSYKYLIASVIMLLVSLSINSLINSGVLCLITQIIVSTLVYFSLLLIMKDKFFMEMFSKYRKK